MLATSRVSWPLAGEWVLEPKFDGWRAVVAVDQDVRVWTRNGHELTDRLPELAPLVDSCGGASVVLDGELVAGQGRADDFYGLLPRIAARARREPLTFVAFDVLAFDGPVIDQPFCRRRALLERLELRGAAWCTVPRLRGTVVDSMNACAEHGVEGIVAKRTDLPYRPGERSATGSK
jgi:bifunctional non-homologous end joining protein LigD